MNTFDFYLQKQLNMHPSAQPQDIVKLCYQAAFGAEHLLSDRARAHSYFLEEYKNTPSEDISLFEEISPDAARVNLAAWKHSGMPCEWLFEMFVMSAQVPHGGEEKFFEYIKAAEKFAGDYIKEYLAKGVRAVHHSEEYRAAERPAYRIVSSRFVRLIPVLQKITADTRVIAVDGRAASGKSTAADALCRILGAGALHMDDFFLPKELRTPKRLSEAGGNVHYERFAAEVLPHLRTEKGFAYNIFDCSAMELCGTREVAASKIKVVEGAYALHPNFGDYADIKVFSDVMPDEQMRRILVRNGGKMAMMFKEKWIPLEEKYFAAFRVKEKADVVM